MSKNIADAVLWERQQQANKNKKQVASKQVNCFIASSE